MLNNRIKDAIRVFITYFSALITFLSLVGILLYIGINGLSLLNLDLITNDYQTRTYIAELKSEPIYNYPAEKTLNIDEFYSTKWGIALKDDRNLMGKNIVVVSYVHENSPFKRLNDKGILTEMLTLRPDHEIIRIAFTGQPSALSIHGAENMISMLDLNDNFRELEYTVIGGGIRGSIIATFYLIGMTLALALPIGVGSAIYLNEYAPKNKITQLLRSFIEVLTGIPSIIYGLLGLALFVPLTIHFTQAKGANLISGAMTLTVILLPIIIRTTEESLKVIPDDFRQASLSLGANQTQTTFKVVLPNAIPGILTATLLAIGRIIGESAALVFAVGAIIKDEISIFDNATSLAVHIWSLMTDEPANIELSTSIAIIILFIVLSLNISIKLITISFRRKLGS